MKSNIDGGDICAKCGSCCSTCWRHLGWFGRGYIPPGIKTNNHKPKETERKRVPARIFEILASDGPIHKAVLAIETYYQASLPVIPNVSKELLEITELLDGARFDLFGAKGFLFPWGCTIPRKFRSDCCRSYTCSKINHLL